MNGPFITKFVMNGPFIASGLVRSSGHADGDLRAVAGDVEELDPGGGEAGLLARQPEPGVQLGLGALAAARLAQQQLDGGVPGPDALDVRTAARVGRQAGEADREILRGDLDFLPGVERDVLAEPRVDGGRRGCPGLVRTRRLDLAG